MNPVVISTIIGAGSFILTIFSAIYLNQRHVDKLMEQMEKRFDAKLDGLRAEIKAEFGTVRAEIQAVNNRIAAVESRIERIERQLDQIFKPALPKSGD
jgi:chromosome segregation ATPase